MTKVVIDELGDVKHIGEFINGEIKKGENVELEINKENRELNSKLHSAAHLIDLAIKNLNLDWVPGKGFHYPEGPYVEYQVNIVPTDLTNYVEKIQAEFNNLTAKNLEVKFTFDETKKVNGKIMRNMSFEGLGELPCGGTHVEKTSELNEIIITKIKAKQNTIRVSYNLKNES